MVAEDDGVDLIADIDANIGANLKAQREKLGLSQAEVADLAKEAGVRGIHQTTIARIEKGERALRAAEAVALSRILETSLEYLAESRETVRLRYLADSLRVPRAAFDEAAKALIAQRWWVARELDRWLPYSEEGLAPLSDVLKANVNLHLYEMIEEVLVNSDPVERLDNQLRMELARVRKFADLDNAPAVKQREQYMLEELIEYVEGDDVEHPEAP